MTWEVIAVAVIATPLAIGFFALYRSLVSAERKRRRRNETYAQAAGWAYAPADPGLGQEFFGVPPFTSGSRPRFEDVIYHSNGTYQGHSFDFSFGVGPSKEEYRHYQHVVSLLLPAALPPMSLRPQYATDSLGIALGLQDISFESEDFNRAWLVRGSSPAAVHDIIHPRTMDWLLEMHNRNLTFGASGRYLFLAISGQQRPERIPDAANRLIAFYHLIPPFVWDKARGVG